jgi:hypothetical protein
MDRHITAVIVGITGELAIIVMTGFCRASLGKVCTTAAEMTADA